MERVAERMVLNGRMEASGTQWRAESSKPESQMAGKPDWAARRAERGEWEDMARSGEVGVRRERSLADVAIVMRWRFVGGWLG